MSYTFRQALEVADFLHSKSLLESSDSPKVNTSRLRAVVLAEKVKRSPGYSIDVLRTEDKGQGFLYSQVLDYHAPNTPGHAVILVSDFCNPCWTRFSVAKELMHVLCDDFKSGFDVHQLLREAREARFSRPTDGGLQSLPSELYNLLLAIEVMIPWDFRGTISDWCHKEKMTNLKIAEKLRIPQAIVLEYFEWFAEYSAEIRKQIDRNRPFR